MKKKPICSVAEFHEAENEKDRSEWRICQNDATPLGQLEFWKLGKTVQVVGNLCKSHRGSGTFQSKVPAAKANKENAK
jgi:hypothetical protein